MTDLITLLYGIVFFDLQRLFPFLFNYLTHNNRCTLINIYWLWCLYKFTICYSVFYGWWFLVKLNLAACRLNYIQFTRLKNNPLHIYTCMHVFCIFECVCKLWTIQLLAANRNHETLRERKTSASVLTHIYTRFTLNTHTDRHYGRRTVHRLPCERSEIV